MPMWRMPCSMYQRFVTSCRTMIFGRKSPVKEIGLPPGKKHVFDTLGRNVRGDTKRGGRPSGINRRRGQIDKGRIFSYLFESSNFMGKRDDSGSPHFP